MPKRGRPGFAALLVVSLAACGPSPESRVEANPSVGVAVGAASPTRAPTEPERNDDTRPDIYLTAPETGEATLLLSERGSQTNAEVSPNGRRVVYESWLDATSQIFVLKADGTTQQLTHGKRGAHDPTWSPDGSQIAFASIPRKGSDADIFVMNADGSRIRRLVGTPNHDGHPDWSPDGSHVVFDATAEIWVVSVHDGELTRLTSVADITHRHGPAMDPTWSPDGRWIAITRYDPGSINGIIPYHHLWVMRSDGTRERRLSPWRHGGHELSPSWSPNGRSIVFDDASGASVRIVEVGTKRRRTILWNAEDAQPSWGPDGILVSLSPDEAVAMPQATVQTGWQPTWEPSWSGRPDTTVVLTGSRCEQDGDAGPLHPGVLTIEFVNEAHLEGLFRVVRLARGQRLGDLWDDVLPLIGRRSSRFLRPSTTEIWSSSREITSGRWAVVCWKDRIAAPNGFALEGAGIVGAIEVG